MFKETKPSRAKISGIKTYIKMSTNQTLNPTNMCCSERAGRPANNCVSLLAAHAKERASGSESRRQWHCALRGCLMAVRISASAPAQHLKTASRRAAHLTHVLLCCSDFPPPVQDFLIKDWLCLVPGTQGSVSSHKPRPLGTRRPSDTNCPISSGCHEVGQ